MRKFFSSHLYGNECLNFDPRHEAILFVNGEMSYQGLQVDYIKKCFVIAVDGGLNHCQHLGLLPRLIVGDFDSIAAEEIEKYRAKASIQALPRDKDRTDTEYALTQVHPDIQRINLLGALGRSSSHFIGNLLLLTRYPAKLFIESEQELIFAIDAGTKVSIHPVYIGQKVSLYPVNGYAAEGITTKGLKWELNQGRLDKYFFGQSNECKEESISLEVEKGELLVFLEK